VGIGQSLCPEKKLLNSEFYSDLLRHYDIFHQCGGILQQTASANSAITLLRPRRKGSFGDGTTHLLAALVPHLQKAMKLHQQFVDLNARSRSLEAAIDLLTVGVMFLNCKGEPILLNRKAEELLQRKDGILLIGRRLGARTPPECSMLAAEVSAAVNGSGFGAGGTFLLQRKNGRPLSVTAAPLRNAPTGFSQNVAAVLFISDPEQKIESPVELLRRCYGITNAEARLTTALVEGLSLKEAADLCGVTHNTAKSQLKSIFLKTNVQRQAQLVRLVMASCALRESE
jgi:DNA-binding CsgD family transcriptional regulator